MDETASYRLSESRQQQRMQDFRQSPNDSLEDEIALARVMVETLANDSGGRCAPLLRDMLQTLSVLVTKNRQRQIEVGELLSRNALTEFARQVTRIVGEEMAGIDGYEDILSRVADRLGEALANTNNNGATQ